jgi:hypothetical protein
MKFKTGKGFFAFAVVSIASTSHPLLDNIGKASTFHTKRRKTKREERKVADRGSGNKYTQYVYLSPKEKKDCESEKKVSLYIFVS